MAPTTFAHERRRGPDLVAVATAAPLAAATAIFLYWARTDGGYAPSDWLHLTVVLLLLLLAVGIGGRVFPRGRLRVAAAFLAAFTAWSFLSISWAGVKGVAWDGANRTLLYLIVFVLFASLSVSPRLVAGLLATYAGGVTAIGVAELWRAVDAASAQGFFITGRFAAPIAYPNATCALFLIAVWPAISIAARRGVPVAVRAVLLACGGALVELALLTQTRGSLVAAPIVAALLLALGPGRPRIVLALAAVVVPAAIFARQLLHVAPAVFNDRGRHEALLTARRDVLVTAAVLLLVGSAWAFVDAKLEVTEELAVVVSRSLAVGAVVAVVAGCVTFALVLGNPIARAGDAWHSFKTEGESRTQSVHLASGFGSARYDGWRIALLEFRQHPLLGEGVDNYLVGYLQHRRTAETTRYPMSIPLRTLSELGIVGALLFAGFLVSALWAAARRLRTETGLARVVGAGALASFAYWFVHGSADWFWEVPALAAPALAFLALAGTNGSERPSPRSSGRWRWAVPTAIVVLAVPAVGSLLLPWAAARQIDSAASVWTRQPRLAFDRLRTAARLNPLSDEADLQAGLLAIDLNDRARAQQAFRAALRRNRYDWYADLMLGTSDLFEGRHSRGIAYLGQALKLNPRDPVVQFAVRRAGDGSPIDEAKINQLFARQDSVLRGARQHP